MTLVAVPFAVEASDSVGSALVAAEDARRRGANLVEWRVDPLAHEPAATAGRAIARLVRESPLPSIVTVRTVREGGRFEGTTDEHAAVLAAASAALADAPERPRYVDVELADWTASGALRDAATGLAGDGGIILSRHDFEGRPRDLMQVAAAMAEEPACRVAKLAWTARSLRDCLEAFELLRHRVKPMVTLCMGEFGLMTRVLAGAHGGLLTFASAGEGLESAPGQPTLDALRERYRFDSITASTRVYGVVGWPVAHSASPAVHNAGFAAIGHDGVYLPLPIAPEWEPFKATMASLLAAPDLNLAGASVTIPHKANLVRFVREAGGRVEPVAEAIGAANTLLVGPDGRLEATNTDVPALREALLDGTGWGDGSGRLVLVHGAGGVARAAVAACAEAGALVRVTGRTPSRVTALVDALADLGDVAVAEPEDAVRADVHVNATPLGMEGGPDPDASPLSEAATAALGPGRVVLDTVYAPSETPLVRAATRAGATVVRGAAMFRRQAARQFEAWTGRPLPEDVTA